MKKMKALLLCLVSIVLAFGVAGCGNSEESSGSGSDKEKVEIRFSWWGDTKRNEIYNSIVDKFEEKHPNITVKREFGGWNDYWEKLATQIAGGNAPDVVSMHQFYVSEYARKNALLDLNEHVKSGVIKLDQFPEPVIESGQLDDKTLMIAKGVTMSGVVYNTGLFDKLGVKYPDMNWTWEDFAAKAIEVDKALNTDDTWGADDLSGNFLQEFRYFVRQNGKDLFNDNGEIAFGKEDLIEWFTMWDKLRKQGAIPDAATSAEFPENIALEQSLFIRGKTGISFIPVNRLYLYQQQIKDGEVHEVRVPTKSGGKNGEFIEGAYLSVSAKTKHPKEAAKFINFFVNEKEALERFKVEQGPPANEKMMEEVVVPLLEPAQKRTVDFVQETVQHAESAPYAPSGVNEIETAFKDTASAIAFGQTSIKDGANKFMKDAKAVLKK